jgi:conjugative relaxase-like TrwC/TraI family protein
MLSISSPLKSSRSQNYYLNLAQQRYYTSEFEAAGRWFGRGASHLNLTGEVREKELHNLFAGRSCDGKQALVQNAGHEKRTKGWDLTFSAPKSVSTLWALSADHVRQQIELCHQNAVAAALSELEQSAGVARRGPAGRSQESAYLVFASFQHGTSRAQDPQLHTHAVAINLTVRQDGTTGSLHSRRLFEQKMRAGEEYRARLAAELRERLGLRVEFEKVGFHVVGVPKGLCAEFSRRRQQVEALLKERAQEGAVAAHAAALDSRQPKVLLPRDELFAGWRATGEAFGWGQREANGLIRASKDKERARQDVAVNTKPVHEVAVEPPVRKTSQAMSEPDRQQQPDREPQRQAQAEDPFGSYKAIPEEERRRSRLEEGREEFRRTLITLPEDWDRRNIDRIRQRIMTTYGNSRKDLDRVFRKHYRRTKLLKPRLEWRAFPSQPPWKAAFQRVLSVRKKQLFSLAPSERIRKAAAPAVVGELPRVTLLKAPRYQPRWWTMYWKKNLGLAELRIQERFIAPGASKWSPFFGKSFPAFRLTLRKSKWQPKRRESVERTFSHETLHMMTRT